LFAKDLTKDLASHVFFGDDILLKCNVFLGLDNHRKSLDTRKLKEIKATVKQTACKDVSDADFEVVWSMALQSLHQKCKNLRAKLISQATSSELTTFVDCDD